MAGYDVIVGRGFVRTAERRGLALRYGRFADDS